jgi:hypothetical protein
MGQDTGPGAAAGWGVFASTGSRVQGPARRPKGDSEGERRGGGEKACERSTGPGNFLFGKLGVFLCRVTMPRESQGDTHTHQAFYFGIPRRNHSPRRCGGKVAALVSLSVQH